MKIIVTNQTENTVTYAVEGRLDTTTAPQLEAEWKTVPETVKEFVLDCKGLDYISSAGLRVLLSAHKGMKARNGRLVVTGINEVVNEIFEVTGFSDILIIE